MGIDFEALRERYRPQKIELLLIAEAPPKPPPARFFYFDKFVYPDNLYMEIMSVIFLCLTSGERTPYDKQQLRQYKESYLRKFQYNGFWLQDAVPDPGKAIKKNEIVDRLSKIVEDYNVNKCIIIKKTPCKYTGETVYDMLKTPLEKLKLEVLNDKPLHFPASGQQRIFREEFAECLKRNGYELPLLS